MLNANVLSFALIFMTVVAISGKHEVNNINDKGIATSYLHRIERQASSTPPPKKRPANIFRLFSVLLAETRDDARKAFSDIGKIFNSQFANGTNRPTSSIPAMTTSSNSSSGEETATSTEAYKISRDEFNGIIMSNFRGILRLFGKELGNAIRDSTKNVRDFGRDLRAQVRPYVTP